MEGISPTELAEIGVILLTAMSSVDRRSWRQLARQCDRRDQREAAREIGDAAHEAWIGIYAVRMTR